MIDTRTAPYAALLLRLALGTMFVAHALLKLFVFTLPGTAQFFESLGLPAALAYVTFAAELVGGALLILGIGTRWVAAALIPFLLGAASVHLGNGWLFSAPKGGWEYPVVPDRRGLRASPARRRRLCTGQPVRHAHRLAPAGRLIATHPRTRKAFE